MLKDSDNPTKKEMKQIAAGFEGITFDELGFPMKIQEQDITKLAMI